MVSSHLARDRDVVGRLTLSNQRRISFKSISTEVTRLVPSILPGIIQFWDKKHKDFSSQILNSVADPDPGSGAFLTPGSGVRDG
jgi:hypothetical protein